MQNQIGPVSQKVGALVNEMHFTLKPKFPFLFFLEYFLLWGNLVRDRQVMWEWRMQTWCFLQRYVDIFYTGRSTIWKEEKVKPLRWCQTKTEHAQCIDTECPSNLDSYDCHANIGLILEPSWETTNGDKMFLFHLGGGRWSGAPVC